MTRRALLLFALSLVAAACGRDGGPVPPWSAVHVEGSTIVLEGNRALRALEIDLAWDSGLTVSGFSAGADVARLNLVRSFVPADAQQARVLISDTRKVRMPSHGEVLKVTVAGSGTLRVTAAQAADVDGKVVAVEVR